MKHAALILSWLLPMLAAPPATQAAPSSVCESARSIPVAAEVDVVVVGGSTAAVSAATAAAKAGAKVFLAAPRTYLGEDMAGTLRLWLEEGESPTTDLARRIFADPDGPRLSGIPFTYEADLPSVDKHKDANPPSRLNDGRIGDVQKQSVQYDGDVALTVDLGRVQEVGTARVVLFDRPGDFAAQSVAVRTSTDRAAWKDLGVFPCGPAEQGTVAASSPVGAAVRYLRFKINRAPGARRLLVAEIVVEPRAAAVPPAAAAAKPVRPLHLKKTLDDALQAAKVDFLYGCYATDVLTDGQGKPCGIVMANRAGRQAVIAKTIVDATEHATVARMAGAEFGPFRAGTQTVRWTVIAEKARSAADLTVRRMPWPVDVHDRLGKGLTGKTASWYEYSLPVALPDDSWAARARLEQAVRDAAFDPAQLYSPDSPFLVPPVSIKGVQSASGSWAGADKVSLDALRPAAVERVWVLGGCADVTREAAEKLLRPAAFMEVGFRVGEAAAAEAKQLRAPEGVRVLRRPPAAGTGPATGEVRELLDGLRPLPAPRRVPQEAGPLPILGRYDVVVVGGGTAGAPAGIGAARQGAKTLVIECLNGLGGVGTLGMIGKYWYGNRVGFTSTIPDGPLEIRMEAYRRELRKAGADIWFGALGCGTLMEGRRVVGVVVATPLGRGVVPASVVIDGTGNADVAIEAGAEYVFVEDHFAVQASHRPPREVGASYMNGDIPALDDADPINVRQVILDTPRGPQFDRGPLLDSRERRRIVGDYTLDWLDQINRRTFPDSIVYARSDYDSHGYQIHPYFMLKPARPPGEHARQFYSYVPYRCLLPRGMDGILVTGLGCSAHRDAMPIIRMQPDLHNQGYAAGVAAAMAAKAGITPRQINVKALQKHLVEIGNLPPSVLTDGDSYPMSREKLSAAVNGIPRGFEGLEILLAQPEDGLPLLRRAYASARDADRLAYAEVLGVMGDATGLPVLLAEAERSPRRPIVLPQDADPKSAPLPQPDEVTRLIWALGGAGDRQAAPRLAAMARDVDRSDATRTRAICVSLGRLGDPAGADVLAEWVGANRAEPGLRELLAACALYRCGDKDGLARTTLENIARGTNGPFARLAWQVLRGEPGKPASRREATP